MIYFDAGATTLEKPAAVGRAMARAAHTMSSPGRGSYPASRLAGETAYLCRQEAAELLGVPQPENVVITGSATHGLNLAIRSLLGPGDRVALRLNPGLTFGTGSHATTRLCLTALEKHITGGQTVLDLGCGSGILSIAALLLGADRAVACDIDEKCMDVAYENAALNGVGRDRYTVRWGDVVTDQALRQELGGPYDVVVANIVADVIKALASTVRPLVREGGIFLCSGIIDDRAEEVAQCLRDNGWTIAETRSSEGWFSYLCR